MKWFLAFVQCLAIFVLLGWSGDRPALWIRDYDAGMSSDTVCDGEPPSGCTVFTVSRGEQVFFGGNDDYINPDSYYWVDPGDSSNYGAIWIGQPDNVQQGVNERGLAYDANGLPRVDVNPHDERLPVSGSYTSYPIHILRSCATVEEVITWVNTHRWHTFMHDQMQFADATGDAVIISVGADGEVAFTRKPKGDGFLVSTNFNVARPSNGFSYPCWRYDLAQELLGQLVSRESELTVEDAVGVLDAVHVEGGASWTIESMVADLPNGLVYLYYFHQYDRPVVLSVAEEITNPRDPGPLSRLFPEEVKEEAQRRYDQIQAKAGRCRRLGIAWMVLVIFSLFLLRLPSIGGRKGLVFWVLAVIILGPLALFILLLVGRSRKPVAWRAALLESVGNVLPGVVALVVILILFIQVPGIQANGNLQLVVGLAVPLIVGLLLFHGPMLTAPSGVNFGRFSGRRLPQLLVATNLGMGGIVLVAIPLINETVNVCTIFPLNVWAIMIWWAIAILGTLLGGLLLFVYETWAVKRGYRAWSVLALREGEVKTPGWRQLWWWILLSYIALIGGIAAGAAI